MVPGDTYSDVIVRLARGEESACCYPIRYPETLER